MFNKENKLIEYVSVGESITLKIKVQLFEDLNQLVLGYVIKDRLGQPIFGTNTHHYDEIINNAKKGEFYEFLFCFDVNLGIGSYSISTAIIKDRTAYYDILEAKRTIGVDQESVSNYEKHLTNVQQLYTAGSKPKSDLLRSEVSLADARQTLIKAQNDYDVDVITLKNIIKMNRDEELNLTEDFQYIPFDRQLADCLSYAAENRKDLKESQIDYDVAQKNVELAKVGYKPTVSASVGTSWNTQMLPSVSNHGYTVGLSTSWDIFDNGLTKADVASAEAALDEAQLTLQQKSDNIDLAVRQAYLDMREAEKRFNSTQTAVDQAEEDMFIAQEKYRVGAGVILDVIDAQLALSTAELNHISAQYDYARDKAELENAMGLNEEIAG